MDDIEYGDDDRLYEKGSINPSIYRASWHHGRFQSGFENKTNQLPDVLQDMTKNLHSGRRSSAGISNARMLPTLYRSRNVGRCFMCTTR